jgi:hypothetical protein
LRDFRDLKKNVLFCPTVGPILSGVNPGVSLYNVFIFSKSVFRWWLERSLLEDTSTYCLPCPVETDDDDRELLLPS